MEFFSVYGESLLKAIYTHLYYVIVAVSGGFVIALILGITLALVPRLKFIILPIISIFQTIPGIVFVGIMFIYLGMRPRTVLIALTIYAIFPILKNTYTGILNVDASLIEAAKGCGMSRFERLIEIELPLALPSIIGGLRMSTVYTVSWAALAAMIGLGGLGEFIYIGIPSNNNRLVLAGAIPSAIMALVFSQLIDLLKRKLTPRGLRIEAKNER